MGSGAKSGRRTASGFRSASSPRCRGASPTGSTRRRARVAESQRRATVLARHRHRDRAPARMAEDAIRTRPHDAEDRHLHLRRSHDPRGDLRGSAHRAGNRGRLPRPTTDRFRQRGADSLRDGAQAGSPIETISSTFERRYEIGSERPEFQVWCGSRRAASNEGSRPMRTTKKAPAEVSRGLLRSRRTAPLARGGQSVVGRRDRRRATVVARAAQVEGPDGAESVLIADLDDDRAP